MELKRGKAGVALGVLALACLAGVGAAHGAQARAFVARAQIRARPAAIAHHITSLGYPYTKATCHGLGKRKHRAYAAFRCVVKGTVIYYAPLAWSLTLWARPLRGGGWCGSAFSLKTCHRLTMPVYGNENKCATNSNLCDHHSSDTNAALNAHLYHGPQPANTEDYLCKPSGTNTYACNAGSTQYTVSWAKASYGWLPTVTRPVTVG
jgi:hypothetical protein